VEKGNGIGNLGRGASGTIKEPVSWAHAVTLKLERIAETGKNL